MTTTYAYDVLNRPTQNAYNDGMTPTAGYFYDVSGWWYLTSANPIGQMTAMNTYNAAQGYTASVFSYDVMGRQNNTYPCLPAICWSATGGNFVQGQGYATLSYGYNLAGDSTSGTNGAGTTISYGYDAANRPISVSSSWVDSQHPATLALVNPTLGYYPTGQLRVMTLGNGLTQSTAYEPRMQPCASSLNSSGTALGTCGDPVPNGQCSGDSPNCAWNLGSDRTTET